MRNTQFTPPYFYPGVEMPAPLVRKPRPPVLRAVTIPTHIVVLLVMIVLSVAYWGVGITIEMRAQMVEQQQRLRLLHEETLIHQAHIRELEKRMEHK